MSTLPKKRYTIEEYLELEARAQYKSQFYKGEIFAMAGASFAHNQIAMNITGELQQKLRGTNCQVLPSDMLIKCRSGLYTYANAVVVCGDPMLDKYRGLDVLLNARIVIEVLSDSTELFDRGKKFEHYQSIASFREYVLVAQDRCHVDHFERQDDGSWRLNAVNGREEAVELRSAKCTLRLAEVYDRVQFPPEPEPAAEA